MRRYLYLYVALALTSPLAFGQDKHQEEPVTPPADQPVQNSSALAAASQSPLRPASHARPVTPRTQPYQHQQNQPPLGQYSPLAANGGYLRGGGSPWQAIVNYFNPHHLNMGKLWEERRQAWLDNAAVNQYFWYCFWVTGILILSWCALWWVHDDWVRDRWDLAENAADALRYSEHCKRQAQAAIARYNAHVEKCNRVVECRESGLATPEMANLDSIKRELDKLKADNGSLNFQNARLTDELNQKSSTLNSLTQRVSEAEEKLQKAATNQNATPNAQLVERINRLEQENRQLKQRKPVNGSTPEQKTTQRGEGMNDENVRSGIRADLEHTNTVSTPCSGTLQHDRCFGQRKTETTFPHLWVR